MAKKEEGIERSKYYSDRYDHYTSLGHPNGLSAKLAHVDLAKEFKQKNPTIDNLNKYDK